MFLVNFLSFFNATIFRWFDYCCLCPFLCSWTEAVLAHHRDSARAFTRTSSTVLVFFCLMVMLLAMHLQKLSSSSLILYFLLMRDFPNFPLHLWLVSSVERLLVVADQTAVMGRTVLRLCLQLPLWSCEIWALLCTHPASAGRLSFPRSIATPNLLLDPRSSGPLNPQVLDPSPQAPLNRGLGPSVLLCPLSAAQDKVLVASLPGSQTKGHPQWRHRRYLLILTNYPFIVQLERKSVLIFVFLKRNFIKWDIHL